MALTINGRKLNLQRYGYQGQDIIQVVNEEGATAADFTKTRRQSGPMTEVTSDGIFTYTVRWTRRAARRPNGGGSWRKKRPTGATTGENSWAG
ncbi:MAG: hypothetical protein LRY55_15840 [Leadbetterella sp.]|nr:hypothetical protein [Leadbetterella sp.]